MAGYSSRPLRDKLGIKPDTRVLFRNEPANYEELVGPLPADLRVARQLSRTFDFIQGFFDRLSILSKDFPRMKKCLAKDGMIWISWPKKSSGVHTDITENEVRETGLLNGLVDVKVCAVEETWSGLKFVYRKKDR
jgi:hypothetical protein